MPLSALPDDAFGRPSPKAVNSQNIKILKVLLWDTAELPGPKKRGVSCDCIDRVTPQEGEGELGCGRAKA